MLSVLLMTGLAENTQAAPTASYSATSTGTTDNPTLSGTIIVADTDLDKTGNYYVVFEHQDTWLFLTPQGWVAHQTGPYPIFQTGALSGGSAEVLLNADVREYIGARLYVGYGLTENDMTPLSNSNLTTAVLDMQTAYADAAGRPTPDFLNTGAGNIGSLTLQAGLYNWSTSVIIPNDLVLNGGANDVCMDIPDFW